MKVELIQKEYILSLEEFFVIASRMGMARIFSFERQQRNSLDWKQFIMVLHQMELKGQICISDDMICIMQPYLSLFQEIKEADYVLSVGTIHEQLPDKCCYYGKEDSMIVTEAFFAQEDMLRVYQQKKEELLQVIMEEGYLAFDSDPNTLEEAAETIVAIIRLWNVSKEEVVEEVWLKKQSSITYMEAVGILPVESTRYEKKSMQTLLAVMLGGMKNASN